MKKSSRKPKKSPDSTGAGDWRNPQTVIEKQTEAEKTRLLKEALNPFWASRMSNR
jgi:hypothetical protein